MVINIAKCEKKKETGHSQDPDVTKMHRLPEAYIFGLEENADSRSC